MEAVPQLLLALNLMLSGVKRKSNTITSTFPMNREFLRHLAPVVWPSQLVLTIKQTTHDKKVILLKWMSLLANVFANIVTVCRRHKKQNSHNRCSFNFFCHLTLKYPGEAVGIYWNLVPFNLCRQPPTPVKDRGPFHTGLFSLLLFPGCFSVVSASFGTVQMTSSSWLLH